MPGQLVIPTHSGPGNPPLSLADHGGGMRIAIVTESFYPAVDGTTRTVKHVVDRLVDTGHDVLVIAPAPGLTSYRGCRVARINGLEKRSGQVRAALADFRPDLVHVASPGAVGRRALAQAGRLGLPSLVVQQSPVPLLERERWQRTVGGRADHVAVTCRWMRERLGEFGVDAPVWTPGVDPAAFTPRLRDERVHDAWSRKRRTGGQLVVGYVGSLRRRHGVRRLAALGQVTGIRVVLIGDGPQRGWLKQQLPSAKFLGTLETGDLTSALATLDLLVHPGERETCCHILREAGASGVPVVAAAAGGNIDVLLDGRTGILYDPDDPRALRRAVALLADPVLRAELGAAAREVAEQRTWTDAVDELVCEHYATATAIAARRGLTVVA